jgi:hypothetical protein
MMVTPRLLLLTLALVLFAVAAYLSTDLATRLTRAAFAIVVLAWLWP